MLCASLLLHAVCVLVILVSPSLSYKKKSRTDIHRVSMISLPLSLQAKLPVAQAPESSAPPPAKTPPPEKKVIPQPKKEVTPKPVAAKAEEVTTIAKKDEQPAEESFNMGNSMEGVQRAGSMMLDSAYFPYMYYLKAIRDKIARNWFPPFGVVSPGETLSLIVHFRIAKNGTIMSSEVEQNSGNTFLDQSALRAILVSDPFPPLPFGFADDDLGIHFRFECTR